MNENTLEQSPLNPKLLPSQLNWIKNASGRIESPVYEHPLFTDAHITAEMLEGLGPYSFVNTIASSSTVGVARNAILLRVVYNLESPRPEMTKTDEDLYHGGDLVDEIASLTSLLLGIRIRAGSYTRRFDDVNDRFGRPCGWNEQPPPTINVRQYRTILPTVVQTRSLQDLEKLKSIPFIEGSRFVSLIRACKYYQDALWVAESEPNLAWLMLVSAIETAANDFYVSSDSPESRLRNSLPNLASLLEESGVPQLVPQVAEMISHTLGATKKFIDFTMKFMPKEPTVRPVHDWKKLKWSTTSIKAMLNLVYKYRSRALHAGIPFPAPMCEPPYYAPDCNVPSEVPLVGLASHSCGGTWLPNTVPINLHCFHYITRGVLLGWWDSIRNESK